ncbi:hypothetical protein CB0940_04764 [Cercospora beticola]|uniref:BTB domain-containing protein n=1 Tax=Cercospora beticola TaxID=122368 RepID=A0A2G5HLV4_CERBT|nr:hypothetical protein CB0940_04764 [Cercospora beticola]PIA93510.1 hypothetical protein CB0940_04764 [Cercospora beticola]WPB02030.1 hypothetical protein RHO25_006664 [Cercospora beticola]
MTYHMHYDPNMFGGVLQSASQATDLTAPPIKVKVGQSGASFSVHKKTLCQASEHFRAIFANPKTEIAVPIELPDISATTFNLYVNWLRDRKIYAGLKDNETPAKNGVTARLILAYRLATKILDIDFHDAITDAMITHWSSYDAEEDRYWLPHQRFRKILYNLTSPGSKARALLVHRMTTHKATRAVNKHDHPAFLADFEKKLKEKDPDSASLAAAKCKYHEHMPGSENCYRNKFARRTTLQQDDKYLTAETLEEENKGCDCVTIKQEDIHDTGGTVKEEDKHWIGVTVMREHPRRTVEEEDKHLTEVKIKKEDED